jgi:hypothetical protein
METKSEDLEGLAEAIAKPMEPEKKDDDTTPKATDPVPPAVEAPDPEEDDLDDLDGTSNNVQ